MARVRVGVSKFLSDDPGIDLGLGLGRTYFHKPTHSASIHNKCTQITSVVGCE